jgi:hypothetical protein
MESKGKNIQNRFSFPATLTPDLDELTTILASLHLLRSPKNAERLLAVLVVLSIHISNQQYLFVIQRPSKIQNFFLSMII